MRSTDQSLLDHLEREEREFQRRLSMLRQQRPQAAFVMDLHEGKSVNFFNAALEASSEQHEEVVWRRLADKSQALRRSTASAGYAGDASPVAAWRPSPPPPSAFSARRRSRPPGPPEGRTPEEETRVTPREG